MGAKRDNGRPERGRLQQLRWETTTALSQDCILAIVKEEVEGFGNKLTMSEESNTKPRMWACSKGVERCWQKEKVGREWRVWVARQGSQSWPCPVSAGDGPSKQSKMQDWMAGASSGVVR